VTDQLVKKFPGRVIDFPPDETSLLGAAMGFSQVGLTPIVEIPYAKYLDCGVDMFYEIAIMNWLSAGQQPNGMIIRLQGVRTVFVTIIRINSSRDCKYLFILNTNAYSATF
jgi:pyruvate/2-oxoglutarate/acetoin dehydrogenase E1 component